MGGSAAIPIATAVAAVAVLVALAAVHRRRPATKLWLVLVPVAITPAVGWYWALRLLAAKDERALEMLRWAALSTAAVMSCAALILGLRAASRAGSTAPRLHPRALWSGLFACSLLSIAFRAQPSVLIAAVPAAAGVFSVALGARALDPGGRSSNASAAFEILVAVSLALGAVACASIAVACTVLGIRPDAPADALGALGRATAYAIPPAVSAAAALAGRIAALGRGAIGRLRELAVSVVILFVAAGALRVALGWIVEGRSKSKIAVTASEDAVPIASAPVRRGIALASAVREEAPNAPHASADRDAALEASEPDNLPGSLVSFGEIHVSGMLAPVEVRRGVEKIRPRIEKCRENAGDPPPEGDITVKFSIGPSGSVSSVQDDGTTNLTNRKFIGCVLASFYQIGFPQPTRGNVRVEASIQLRQP